MKLEIELEIEEGIQMSELKEIARAACEGILKDSSVVIGINSFKFQAYHYFKDFSAGDFYSDLLHKCPDCGKIISGPCDCGE